VNHLTILDHNKNGIAIAHFDFFIHGFFHCRILCHPLTGFETIPNCAAIEMFSLREKGSAPISRQLARYDARRFVLFVAAYLRRVGPGVQGWQ
jgi:hypothetical protein